MPGTPLSLPLVAGIVTFPGPIFAGGTPTGIYVSWLPRIDDSILPGSLGAPNSSTFGDAPSPHWLLLVLIVKLYIGTESSGTGTLSSNTSKLNVFQGSSCGTATHVL